MLFTCLYAVVTGTQSSDIKSTSMSSRTSRTECMDVKELPQKQDRQLIGLFNEYKSYDKQVLQECLEEINLKQTKCIYRIFNEDQMDLIKHQKDNLQLFASQLGLDVASMTSMTSSTSMTSTVVKKRELRPIGDIVRDLLLFPITIFIVIVVYMAYPFAAFIECMCHLIKMLLFQPAPRRY